MLRNVLFVPSLSYNLISVSVMEAAVQSFIYEIDRCRVQNSGLSIAEGTRRDILYLLDTSLSSPVPDGLVALVADLTLWHQRLAHVHVYVIRSMILKGVFKGIHVYAHQNCQLVLFLHLKSTLTLIPKQGGPRCSGILGLVHTGVCGKVVESLSASIYFVTILDDHSIYFWVYAMRSESEVLSTFIKWLAMFQKQTDISLRKLQCDHGGEYISNAMEKLFVYISATRKGTDDEDHGHDVQQVRKVQSTTRLHPR